MLISRCPSIYPGEIVFDFWDVTLPSGYKTDIPQKHSHVSAELHVVASQKIVNLLFTAMRNPNLKQ
jgi:hypothetical protein